MHENPETSCCLRSAVYLAASTARRDPAVPLPSIAGDWFFHWDKAPGHTAAFVQEWLAARGARSLEHLPYSPELARADLFYFSKMKEGLTDRHIAAGDLKKTWEGVSTTLKKDHLAAAFWQWLDQGEKCVDIGDSHVFKS